MLSIAFVKACPSHSLICDPEKRQKVEYMLISQQNWYKKLFKICLMRNVISPENLSNSPTLKSSRVGSSRRAVKQFSPEIQ